MSKDSTVKKGGAITVRVRKKRRGGPAEDRERAQEAESPRARGFASVDDESPLYVRRRKVVGFTFYDLSRRYDPEAEEYVTVPALYDLTDRASFNAALLSGDFDDTSGSRPNCPRLPFASDNLQLELRIGAKTYLLGEGGRRPGIRASLEAAEATGPDEGRIRYPPSNAERSEEWERHETAEGVYGSFPKIRAKQDRWAVDSVGPFASLWPYETGIYKVTSEPDPSAPDARLPRSAGYEVFLAPRFCRAFGGYAEEFFRTFGIERIGIGWNAPAPAPVPRDTRARGVTFDTVGTDESNQPDPPEQPNGSVAPYLTTLARSESEWQGESTVRTRPYAAAWANYYYARYANAEALRTPPFVDAWAAEMPDWEERRDSLINPDEGYDPHSSVGYYGGSLHYVDDTWPGGGDEMPLLVGVIRAKNENYYVWTRGLTRPGGNFPDAPFAWSASGPLSVEAGEGPDPKAIPPHWRFVGEYPYWFWPNTGAVIQSVSDWPGYGPLPSPTPPTHETQDWTLDPVPEEDE